MERRRKAGKRLCVSTPVVTTEKCSCRKERNSWNTSGSSWTPLPSLAVLFPLLSSLSSHLALG
ncbi:hypothetical protein AOLI_G00309770 [Acnodon oligacanthus]